MITLPRLSPKRFRTRLEELIKISVHGVVTNKGGEHTVVDRKNGITLQFVDEMVDGQWRLVVYQNGVATPMSYQLVEKPIRGVIKNKRHWSNDCQYYILVNGRRYSHLYVDKENRKVGTRHCFGAVYTIDSIGEKQKPYWRDIQKAKRKAAR